MPSKKVGRSCGQILTQSTCELGSIQNRLQSYDFLQVMLKINKNLKKEIKD